MAGDTVRSGTMPWPCPARRLCSARGAAGTPVIGEALALVLLGASRAGAAAAGGAEKAARMRSNREAKANEGGLSSFSSRNPNVISLGSSVGRLAAGAAEDDASADGGRALSAPVMRADRSDEVGSVVRVHLRRLAHSCGGYSATARHDTRGPRE